MVEMMRSKIGLALLPAMILILFLTATVTTFLFVAQEGARQANVYAGTVAAKWAARAGVHLAEAIMIKSDFTQETAGGWQGIDASFTRNTTLNGAARWPSNLNLPVYVAARYGFYSVYPRDVISASPPSVLWGTSPWDIPLSITIAGSPNSRVIYLRVETRDLLDNRLLRYRGNAFNYRIDAVYYKTYVSDFLYSQGTYGPSNEGSNYIHLLSPAMDCDRSLGIRVNGFWNVRPDSAGSTIDFGDIYVSGYMRVINNLSSGTNDALTAYGGWFFGSSYPKFYEIAFPPLSPPAGNLTISRTLGQSTSSLPTNLFRFTSGTGMTYFNYNFETERSTDYGTDRGSWDEWRTAPANNVGTYLIDRTTGARPRVLSPYTSSNPSVASYLLSRLTAKCDSRASFTAGYSGYYATDAQLKSMADELAGKINAVYGPPNVAKGRLMVNTIGSDQRLCAVEIDMGVLCASSRLDGTTNNIYIKLFKPPFYSVGPGYLAVVLKNCADMSNAVNRASPVTDISFLVKGSIFTHGNVNIGLNRPTLTLIAYDRQYVLSSDFVLSNVYLGTANDGASGYSLYNEEYIAHKLCIVDPKYANDIHVLHPDVEYPLANIDGVYGRDVTCPDQPNNPGANIHLLALGQYWLYDPYTEKPIYPPARNTSYAKKVNEASPTTINATIINSRGQLQLTHEYWHQNVWGSNPSGGPINFTFTGSQSYRPALAPGQPEYMGYQYNEFCGPSYGLLYPPTLWQKRANGTSSSYGDFTNVTYYNAGVFAGSPNITNEYYEASFIPNPPSPITFDKAYRYIYSERLER